MYRYFLDIAPNDVSNYLTDEALTTHTLTSTLTTPALKTMERRQIEFYEVTITDLGI
jgi:hypothetical protein